MSNTHQVLFHIKESAGSGKRVVFVSGNFNTVHPGHLRLLRFAAECGDYLVVGVNKNHIHDSLISEELRLEGIKSISFVDYAFILRAPPAQFIRELKPSVVVKGKEHETHSNPEQEAVDSYGGKLLFSSGDMRFSSIDLLRQEMLESNLSTIVRPTGFPASHGFTMAGLRATLEKFKGLRVVVLGDLIVDEYINCDPVGMSQEDPTLVVTPIQHEKFVGGAAIVAAHAQTLGADVSYLTVSGKDASADFARKKLQEYGVTAEVFEDDSRPTTLKQRYRAAGKTLLRVSHLRQHAISQQIAEKMLAELKRNLPKSDLVIFSDFNYGCLPQPLVDEISDICRRRKIMMVADSQSSSQLGDVSRFKGMMLLTPTEREARLAVRDFESGLVVLAEKLRKKARAKNIILTLGAEGLLTHASWDNGEYVTDRLPAFNTSPKDTAGAGDSLLTCSSMALAVEADIWQSVYLGSIAAACQVSRVGNIPISLHDVRQELSD
ncbi:MAG: adenylyltransferase/cytidyltransferase family protein [Sideroxydans sp.]|nr:adenylyltransferase/cytidyltransferase family protein [Sideroxydans sp.]